LETGKYIINTTKETIAKNIWWSFRERRVTK
jgi:hypothetical protein